MRPSEVSALVAVAEAATPAGRYVPAPAAHLQPVVEAVVRAQFGPGGLPVYLGLLRALDLAALPITGRRLSKLPLADRQVLLERFNENTATFWLTRAVTAPIKAAQSRAPAVRALLGLPPEGPPVLPEPARWQRQILDLRAADADEELEVDCVVVGTGAGGAPMAKVLAERGHAVLMLEAGGHFTRADFQGDPFVRQGRMFRDGGATIAWGNAAIPVPMGVTVGGSTTINSGTCYRAPDRVLARWAREEGLDALGPGSLDPYFDRVERMLRVTRATWDTLGGCAQVIRRGAEALGLAHEPLLRNAPDCDAQGECCFGCPTDAKRSTNVSYVPAALAQGAALYSHARVHRVLLDGDRAVGVVAHAQRPDGSTVRLTVRAGAVVLAAGTLGTAALLLKQGLANSSGRVGRGMSVHPACYAWARFDEDIRGWEAIPQGYAVEEFVGTGLRFEGAYLPPALAAASLGQVGPRWTEMVEHLHQLACFGFMVTDTSRGRVFQGPQGKARHPDWLNEADRKQMIRGHAILAHIYLAAGARAVYPGLRLFGELRSEADVRRFEAEAPGLLKPRHIDISAYHPLGSCRMGGDRRRSAVGPTHETWDVRHLFVCDGSAVPGPLGVNPQVTIMALSERAATFVERRVEEAARRPPVQEASAVEFTETMAGEVDVYRGPAAGRRVPAEFTVRARLRHRDGAAATLDLEGTVTLPGICERGGCAGTLLMRPAARHGTLIYDLDFLADDGRPLHLHGEKDVGLLGLVRGMTTLTTRVSDETGAALAGGVLRFDLRDVPIWLRTWRLGRPRA